MDGQGKLFPRAVAESQSSPAVYRHTELHAPKSNARREGSLNLKSCEKVSAPGLSFCDDAVIYQGMAYITCDPLRLWNDPVRGVWEETPVAARRKIDSAAGIWAWDLRQEGSVPRKLKLKDYPVEHIHPLGVSVVNADPSQLNSSDPQSLLLLVSNQPKARQRTVVDVFLHDLDNASGGRQNDKLIHHTRLRSDHFVLDRKKDTAAVSPYRITPFLEQYSPPLPSEHVTSSKRTVQIPSFFFTALADPIKTQGASQTAFSNYIEFVKYLLVPTHAASPRDLYLYLARAAKTTAALTPLGSWPGFAPHAKAWDGGGERAGYNSSAAMIMTLDTSTEDSSLHLWDQHWVQGIEAGIEEEPDPYAWLQDQRAGIPSERKSGVRPVERWIKNYHPSFLNFWSKKLRYPSTALDVDDWGRSWTGGSPDTFVADKWISYLRHSFAQGKAPHEAPEAASVKRPATLVDQTTYIYRQGSTVAHPWEMERMKLIRDRGVFIPKDYISTTIFKEGEKPAAQEWKPILVSEDGSKQYGFVPTLPTGMAVDRVGQMVLITGAYEERGVAKCTIPADWAEL